MSRELSETYRAKVREYLDQGKPSTAAQWLKKRLPISMTEAIEIVDEVAGISLRVRALRFKHTMEVLHELFAQPDDLPREVPMTVDDDILDGLTVTPPKSGIAQPTEWLGNMMSSTELAKMLQCSPERARQLCERFGTKNNMGHWRVQRTWAEKFAKLRRAHLDLRHALKRAKDAYNNEKRNRSYDKRYNAFGSFWDLRAMARSHYRINQLIDDLDELDLPRGVTLSTGERLSLLAGEREVLRVLGPVLGLEEASVLRALTMFRRWNNPNETLTLCAMASMAAKGIHG